LSGNFTFAAVLGWRTIFQTLGFSSRTYSFSEKINFFKIKTAQTALAKGV